MRYKLSWQTVVVFCVVFVAVSVLVWKGAVDKVILASLITWFLPSPLEKKE